MTKKNKQNARSAAINLRLDWCSYKAAKYAVEHWHYSKCMPAGKTVKIGIWENRKFIGCIIFSMGAQIDLVKQYGLTPFQGCELTRIAMKTHKSPVTKCVAIALKMLRKIAPKLRLVVSFADPKENHFGVVYQAGNWIYTGKSDDCPYAIIGDRIIHPRTVSEWIKMGLIKERKSLLHKIMPGIENQKTLP